MALKAGKSAEKNREALSFDPAFSLYFQCGGYVHYTDSKKPEERLIPIPKARQYFSNIETPRGLAPATSGSTFHSWAPARGRDSLFNRQRKRITPWLQITEREYNKLRTARGGVSSTENLDWKDVQLPEPKRNNIYNEIRPALILTNVRMDVKWSFLHKINPFMYSDDLVVDCVSIISISR